MPSKPVKKSSSYRDILKNQPFIASTIIYALSGLFCVGFQEVFSFWCKTQRFNGGLGWEDESYVGIVQSAGGFAVIGVQLMITPILLKKLGVFSVIKLTCMLFVPTFGLISLLNNLSGWMLWSMIIPLYAMFAMLQAIIITACGIATNNSVSSDQLGITNGISQASIAMFRAIGPALCGALFGWSTNNEMSFPMDSHLFFLFVSFLAGLCAVACVFYLDESINYMRLSPFNRSPKEPLLDRDSYKGMILFD